jgi:hypothetical protein
VIGRARVPAALKKNSSACRSADRSFVARVEDGSHRTKEGVTTMRFMVLVKANEKSEAGTFSSDSKEIFAAMGKFNEEMAKAGVLLSGEGLHPSSKGARIKIPGSGKPTVTDGPFTEVKELIAGFWMIQVKSKEEAIEWLKRCPTGPEGTELEIRQVYEASDFPSDVFPPEEAAREEALRQELQAKAAKA